MYIDTNKVCIRHINQCCFLTFFKKSEIEKKFILKVSKLPTLNLNLQNLLSNMLTVTFLIVSLLATLSVGIAPLWEVGDANGGTGCAVCTLLVAIVSQTS